jgi:glyoxylase-like metal-dependent hydrolase (beta-lactamase superfamily II)
VDRVAPGHNPVRPWTDFDPEVTRDRAREVLHRAANAMGGEEALRAIAATRSVAEVTRYRAGANQWPGAPLAPMHLSGVLTHDFARGRSAFSGERVTGGTPAPVGTVATPSAGYEQLFGFVVPYDADSLAARARERALAPERVIVTALDGSCRLDLPPSVQASNRPATVLRCSAASAGNFRLRIDSITGLPLEVETQRPSRIYGRENTLYAFGGYRRVSAERGPVLLPALMETRIDGRLAVSTLYRSSDVRPTVTDTMFAIPERARRAARGPQVRVRQIAPGLLYLESDSLYYALAIEQDSSVIVVDAAETERRTRAMLDTVRLRFPRKAIGAVVATHHHPDHLAGLPAVFDDGIPVIAHADNVANVRSIWRAAEGRRPSLSVPIQSVRDCLVLGAGTSNEVRLYALTLAESATHLVAYLPRQRLLFAADVAEGGMPSADLAGAIRQLGLAVDQVATSHTGLQRWPH